MPGWKPIATLIFMNDGGTENTAHPQLIGLGERGSRFLKKVRDFSYSKRGLLICDINYTKMQTDSHSPDLEKSGHDGRI